MHKQSNKLNFEEQNFLQNTCVKKSIVIVFQRISCTNILITRILLTYQKCILNCLPIFVLKHFLFQYFEIIQIYFQLQKQQQ